MSSSAGGLHNRAMELVDEHEEALARGDVEAARRALNDACDHETQATRMMPKGKEPTRSILHRSAASLAFLCGRRRLAHELIADGLKGRANEGVAQELRDLRADPPPLDAAFNGVFFSERANHGDLIQRLKLRRAGNRPIASELAGQVQTAWSRLVSRLLDDMLPDMDVSLDTVSASPGSYNIDLRIRLPKRVERAPVDALGKAREVLESIRSILMRTDGDPGRVGPDKDLAEIVTLLQQYKTNLSVEIGLVGKTEPTTFDFPRPTKKLGQSLRMRTIHRIDSSLIPQADRIVRLFRFVDILSQGRYPTAEELEVVERQVNYYRKAAEILGLVADRGLTPRGTLVVGLSEENRLRATCAYFEATDIGASWVRWSQGETLLDVEQGTASAFLSQVAVNLSGSTIPRRSQTLEAWLETLQPHHYAMPA